MASFNATIDLMQLKGGKAPFRHRPAAPWEEFHLHPRGLVRNQSDGEPAAAWQLSRQHAREPMAHV